MNEKKIEKNNRKIAELLVKAEEKQGKRFPI